jgi:RNA polymerase sigma-70 factor (ECF subfamily)
MGDTEAMSRLIVKYQGRIYNTILKICRNNHDAAELTQETFVKLIEKIDTFEGRSSLYTWLFRVAVNLTLNYCKRRSRQGERSLELTTSGDNEDGRAQLGSFLTDEKACDPAEAAQKKETREVVLEGLNRLDEQQRTIIVLRDIEGMNYVEIAETLELELGTVKSRLSRARAALKDILKEMLG